MQNPELSAPTAVTYTPHVPGAHAQVSLVLRPRRRILPDENLTVPLHVIEGEDWEGFVSETCDTVRACQIHFHVPYVREICSC